MQARITYILLCSCILFNLHLHAQDAKIDSLKQLVIISEDDSTRAALYNHLASTYFYNNTDSANHYATMAYALSRENGISYQVINAAYWISWTMLNKGRFDKVIDVCEKALRIVNTDTVLAKYFLGRLMSTQGVAFYYQGHHVKALERFYKALKVHEKNNDNKQVANMLLFIGNVHFARNETDKALEVYFKSLKLAEALNDKSSKKLFIGNIGGLYFKMKKYDEAIEYLQAATKIAENENDFKGIVLNSTNLGGVYHAIKEYDTALVYLNYALDKAKMNNIIGDLDNIYACLGIVHTDKGNLDQAEKYLLLAENEVVSSNNLLHRLDLYKNLGVLYEKKGRYKQAYDSYVTYKKLKDSLANVNDTRTQIELEMQYDFDKKATADSIAFAKAEEINLAHIQKQKAELSTNRIVKYALMAALIMSIAFFFMLYNRYKISKRQQELLEEKRQLASTKQKELIDSIRYAKRIQDCLLPRENFMLTKISMLKKAAK